MQIGTYTSTNAIHFKLSTNEISHLFGKKNRNSMTVNIQFHHDITDRKYITLCDSQLRPTISRSHRVSSYGPGSADFTFTIHAKVIRKLFGSLPTRKVGMRDIACERIVKDGIALLSINVSEIMGDVASISNEPAAKPAPTPAPVQTPVLSPHTKTAEALDNLRDSGHGFGLLDEKQHAFKQNIDAINAYVGANEGVEIRVIDGTLVARLPVYAII